MHSHLRRKHSSLDFGWGPGRQEIAPKLSKRAWVDFGRITDSDTENPLIRIFAISQHTTVLRNQTHIEHLDCSVNDDITISFYLFDTAKIVYTSSADHRPLHPESDSFCSFFQFYYYHLSRSTQFTDQTPTWGSSPALCPSNFPFSFLCAWESRFLGTNCVFFFVYSCMFWAILCFASTTFLSGIASRTSDLYLVTSWAHSKTLWAGTQAALMTAATTTLPRWPDFPSLARLSARTGLSTARHTPPGNRIGWIPRCLFDEVTQAKVRMDVHQKMGTYLAGCGVRCALIPSAISSPPAHRCNSWR